MQKELVFSYHRKFASLSESPVVHGQKFGLDYLKGRVSATCGLLPVYDFGSVDEKHPELVYNWGYDPVQYNVQMAVFASNPETLREAARKRTKTRCA